jgi:hypothetical protein
MRQVDVRVMSPAARSHALGRIEAGEVNIQNLLALAMLCLFWGCVLYLGLTALG